MKKIHLIKLTCFLLSFYLYSSMAIAQQVTTIGQINNGKGVITNASGANEVLKAGLSLSATISDIRIVWVGGDENSYYLVGTIAGDNVSAKAIQLKDDGDQLRAASGPGVEITCHGTNCGRCDIKLIKFKLYCVCEKNNTPGVEGTCDMTSKFNITAW